jgi:Domain of unknown function (DUF1848)
MIISASYKTDIPAFYGKWFMNRLSVGYCNAINPYNEQIYQVGLRREDVDGFVFWTKNLGPFITKLDAIHKLGYPFVVQYTIHAYPRAFEYSVIDATRSISHMKDISKTYGAKIAVWRYDPILFTSLTPYEYHVKNFEELARGLEGATDEVVISFAQIYKKTRNNLNAASDKNGFTWYDPDDEIKGNLAAELAAIAKEHNMQLTMCSQRRFLKKGVKEARCIDARRLSDIAGFSIRAKLKGNRPECGCYESIDIGEYDTCPHGCIYCYAVYSRMLAQKRFKDHDPTGEILHMPKHLSSRVKDNEDHKGFHQTTLF